MTVLEALKMAITFLAIAVWFIGGIFLGHSVMQSPWDAVPLVPMIMFGSIGAGVGTDWLVRKVYNYFGVDTSRML